MARTNESRNGLRQFISGLKQGDPNVRRLTQIDCLETSIHGIHDANRLRVYRDSLASGQVTLPARNRRSPVRICVTISAGTSP